MQNLSYKIIFTVIIFMITSIANTYAETMSETTQARGVFISFEGGEGGGKSTQSKRLTEYLNAKGIEAIWTREPGGTPVAEKIRNVLVENDMDIKTELLLAYAARVEHVEKVIKPALASGKVVISDRFADSSLAYQGMKVGKDRVLSVHKTMLGDFMPDITFLMDVPVSVGLERAKARGNNNKFEEKRDEWHQKLRDTFLEIQKQFPDRIHSIDGTKNQDEIFEDILSLLKAKTSLLADSKKAA